MLRNESAPTRIGRGVGASVVVFGIFFGALAVWLALSRNPNVDEVRGLIDQLSLVSISLVILLSFTNYILRGIRWWTFCRLIGVSASPSAAMVHYLGGFAFGVTPARLGEAIRVQFLKTDFGVSYDRGSSIAIADRVIDLLAVTILVLLASILVADTGVLGYLAAALLALSIVTSLARPAWILYSIKRVFQVTGRAPRFHASLRRAFRQGSALYAGTALYFSLAVGIAAWFAECLGFHIILGALGLDVNLGVASLIYASATLIGAVSFLPGGLGGFEAVAIVGLTQAGVEMPTAVIAVAAIRLLTLWLSVSVGWLVIGRMLLKGSFRKQRNDKSKS